MKRRTFFSKIGAAVVGVYLGLGVKALPKVEAVDQFTYLPVYFRALDLPFYSSYKAWMELFIQDNVFEKGAGEVMRAVK